MKVKRNPANPTAVMFPFLPGVYLGAERDVDASKSAGSPRFKFNDDPYELGKRDPRTFAYWLRKVKDQEVLAADAEMAAAAGVKFEAPKPESPKSK